jgi:hypothetical protein
LCVKTLSSTWAVHSGMTFHPKNISFAYLYSLIFQWILVLFTNLALFRFHNCSYLQCFLQVVMLIQCV